MRKNKINYANTKKRIEDTYFTVQRAWANGDMSLASSFMTPELMKSFKIKLQWMNFSNKKNIMKKIRLLDEYPISLDCTTKDKMWVYIKGKMVDYVIDVNTHEVMSGLNIGKAFIEYWLFTKNENDEWVLSKILQKNEFNKVIL